jgi:hypothetical protein
MHSPNTRNNALFETMVICHENIEDGSISERVCFFFSTEQSLCISPQCYPSAWPDENWLQACSRWWGRSAWQTEKSRVEQRLINSRDGPTCQKNCNVILQGDFRFRLPTEELPTIIQKQYLCEPQEITSSHNICELNDLDCAVTGNTLLWTKPFGLGYLYRRGFSFTCNRCEYIWEETRNALDRWVR